MPNFIVGASAVSRINKRVRECAEVHNATPGCGNSYEHSFNENLRRSSEERFVISCRRLFIGYKRSEGKPS